MAEYIKPEKDRYIKLSQAIEVLDSCACWWAHDRMELIPAADVRPVVLCRDCEYCRKEDEFEHWCYGFCSPARLVRKDDFCSHGKAVLT